MRRLAAGPPSVAAYGNRNSDLQKGNPEQPGRPGTMPAKAMATNGVRGCGKEGRRRPFLSRAGCLHSKQAADLWRYWSLVSKPEALHLQGPREGVWYPHRRLDPIVACAAGTPHTECQRLATCVREIENGEGT